MGFITRFCLCMLVAGMAASVSHPSQALVEPRPIATDGRIKTIVYNPNDIHVFVGHYGYQSSILFEEDEEIGTISMGDSISWQMVPSGNRLFLKPMEPDATTNMTLITNKRTYMFELHAEEAEDIRDDDITFILRFVYPGSGQNIINFNHHIPVPNVEEEPEKYNLNYSISGPEFIAPIRIFDDGEFTFFQFRDKNAEVPGFFLVYADGTEGIINYRTRGDYIVVERVASQFTLRYGDQVVCVYNETMPLKPGQLKPREAVGF